MRTIPQHTVGHVPLLAGHWRAVLRSGDKPGSPDQIIKMSCPLCGAEADLLDHAIDADGRVSPSIVCPTDCGFHEHVRLDGWDNDMDGPARVREGV